MLNPDPCPGARAESWRHVKGASVRKAYRGRRRLLAKNHFAGLVYSVWVRFNVFLFWQLRGMMVLDIGVAACRWQTSLREHMMT